MNDSRLLVAGALPAAAMAMGVHVLFEWVERRMTRDAASRR